MNFSRLDGYDEERDRPPEEVKQFLACGGKPQRAIEYLLQRLYITVATIKKQLLMATKKKKTRWFGMKLTPEQKQKIKKLANQRGTNQKEAVMQLVEEAVQEEEIKPKPGSVYARNKDLFEVGRGPRDLSTNSKYMEGYGE